MTNAFDDRHGAAHLTWGAVEDIDVLGAPPRARHDVHARGRLALQSLLLRRESSPALVVHLHGSIERQRYELPRFERLSSLEDLDAHVLLLADPTLALNPNLRIGWYIGSEDDDATQHLAALVRHIAAELGVERVIIAGSSAGGFGAMALTPHVPNSLALAFSPQVSVRRFGDEWADALRRAAFPDRSTFESLEDDPALKPRVDLAALYGHVQGGRVWYIQNSGDETHVEQQRDPFAQLGDERVTFIDEFHCAGHNPPTRTRVRAWIERALESPDGDPLDFARPV
ncbi:hypothetical protein AA0Z99_08455 [Agrococcus sp. 1P02AA]|uniref:hypothetical protein n=1 Tax=Agrococcus sp. 1P02AA TaxID=3132259 RepID=UPI0039A6A725